MNKCCKNRLCSQYEALSYQTWMRSIFKGFFTVSWAYLTRIKIKRSKCAHSIRSQILLRSWCSKNFPTFPKNIFSVDPKLGTWFFRRNPESSRDFFKVSITTTCCYTMETLKKFLEDSRFRRENHVPNFGSTEKIFFWKVGNFFDHQGRSKICLRIEWKHFQPLKSSLKRHIEYNALRKFSLKKLTRDFVHFG